MHIFLADTIVKTYPHTAIGYLVANVTVRSSDPFVDELKQTLSKSLASLGINPTNFAVHPAIAVWRAIYEKAFLVSPKTYRSSVEALVRRVTTGKGIWNISNVVDLYNSCSVLQLLPMGGYDLDKISGDIAIRYAKEGEPFLGLGEQAVVASKENHVVYADSDQILCWLWNYKDARGTCIDDATKQVIFFVDSFDHNKAQMALEQLSDNLQKIGATPTQSGVLTSLQRTVFLTR